MKNSILNQVRKKDHTVPNLTMGTMGIDVCIDMITISHLSKPFEISNQEQLSYNHLKF